MKTKTKPSAQARKLIKKAARIGTNAPEAYIQQALAPLSALPVVALVTNFDTHDLVAVSSPAFNGLPAADRTVLIDKAIELLDRLKLPVHER